MIRFLFATTRGRRKVASRQPATRCAYPRLEQLEVRALPNASPMTAAHAGDVARDALADLREAQRFISRLARDVGSSASPTVTADIATLRGDVNAISADVKDGTDPSADVIKAQVDGLTLFANLGTNLTHAVRRDVLDIAAVGADVTVDLSSTPPSRQVLVTTVQANLANLTQILGSNVSSTVSKDLNKLEVDLAAIAGGLRAGKDIAGEVRHAIRDEARLFGDLNGQLAPAVTKTIVTMAFDLVEVTAVGHR
jgi:hypothetical protein